ncbi:MAG TPA: LPS export ABC transporter permease LptF [Steroidobacteraceae bacterium]
MRILQRYMLWEMTVNFAGVTSIALALLLVNQVGAVLARAAQLQYQKGYVLELIGLSAAQNVAILLPFGLMVGIVLAFGRLYHDSEMAAAQACGVGVARVAAAVWLLALPVTALIAWINFDLAPRAAAAEAALRGAALRAGISAPVEAGKFRSFNGGRIVVYARAAQRNGDLTDVFVKRGEGAVVETTVARRARYTGSSEGTPETITLYDGERIEGTPGSNRFRIMRFEQQLIPVQTPEAAAPVPRPGELSTSALLASHDSRHLAELHWRLGLPVMTLVLTVLAVPLGRLRPRQGRYAHVWMAVLVFALYANLALAARTWLEHGATPPALGLWWVHALFLAISLVALYGPGVLRARRARRSAP